MTPSRRGRLVAVEGIDGTGKSTLVFALARALRRRGYSVAVRREPADPRLGRLAQEASVRDAWTGAVYFTVDRHLARPALLAALRTHDLVLSDRSYFSTVAYQGSALPAGDRRRLERLQRGASVPPDLVVLLDLPPSAALERLGARSTVRAPLERRRTLERVAAAYRRLARRGRWRVLDAAHPRSELVAEAVRAIDHPTRRAKRRATEDQR